MSSRKSVSAEASSLSIRASAVANWVLRPRMVSLAPLCATDSRGGEAREGSWGATLPCAMTVLRRFAPLRAVALVFFFIGISARIPKSMASDYPRVATGFATGIRATYQPGPFLMLTRLHLKCPEEGCRDSPRQDSPFRTPCHALPNLGPILYLRPMFLDSRKELTA